MTLQLFYHPLSSFCWKALVPLYEGDVAFEPVMINLGDPDERGRLAALWPFAKFPVTAEVSAAGREVWPEASILIERLAQTQPRLRHLIPADPEKALRVRLLDRVFDLHVQEQMQKIVADRMRPADGHDPIGVAAARATLATAYDYREAELSGPWACGETFTLADCAAVPALYYGNEVQPFVDSHPRLAAYLARLKARPSVARVLEEAGPYFHMFPRD